MHTSYAPGTLSRSIGNETTGVMAERGASAPTPGAAGRMEGYLLKRGSHLSRYVRWNDRYFVLRPHDATLVHYVQRGDVRPKGAVRLGPECTVSDVYMAKRKRSSSASAPATSISTSAAASASASGEDFPRVTSGETTDDDDDANDENAIEANGGGSVGQTAVTSSEIRRRERQPVTQRLAAAAYTAPSKIKKGGLSAVGGGSQRLYCVKISWLRAEKAGEVGHSSLELGERPPLERAQSSDLYDSPYLSPVPPQQERRYASPPPSPREGGRTSSRLVLPNLPLPQMPTLRRTRSEDLAETVGGGGSRPSFSPPSKPSPGSPGHRVVVGESTRTTISAPSSDLQHETLHYLPRPRPASSSYGAPTAPLSPAPALLFAPLTSSVEGREGGKGDGDGDDDGDGNGDGNGDGDGDGNSDSGGEGVDNDNDDGVENDDGNDDGNGSGALVANADLGIKKHYATQMSLQRTQSESVHEQAMQRMYVSARRASYKRNKKRFVQGTKVATAAAAVTTASVLTAGVGLAVGLAFLGLTAAAGGSGAVAEASYKRSKDATSIVLAAPTLEEAQAWRDAILSVISQSGSGISVAASTTAIAQPPLGIEEEWSIRSPVSSPRLGDGGDPGDDHAQTSTRRSVGQAMSAIGRSGASYGFETQWVPLDASPSIMGIGGGWGCNSGGLRIFREEPMVATDDGLGGLPSTSRSARKIFRKRQSMLAIVGSEGQYASPPLKATSVLPAGPLTAFMCLMSHNRIDTPDHMSLVPNSGQRSSFRIVETIDDHCDIIHILHRPLYLFPSWTAPRDFCVLRYWRFEPNGSYIICYDSVQHRECPPVRGYVRGEMFGVHTLAPKRRLGSRQRTKIAGSDDEESLLTQLVQVDPKGWVPKAPSSAASFPMSIVASLAGGLVSGYSEAFGVSELLASLDFRDSLINDHFAYVSMDYAHPSSTPWKMSRSFNELGAAIAAEDDSRTEARARPNLSLDEEDDEATNYDLKYAEMEVLGPEKMPVTEPKILLCTNDPPSAPSWAWAAPDANSFLTRGKNYLQDKKKYNAGPSVFRLFAVDMIETDGTIYSGMCAHPQERVQRALQRERKGLPSDLPPYVVCINIAVAGPPWYHMVFYYAVDDMSLIDDSNGTPFSKLAKQFFFGDSDEFRDLTFKMIPRIMEGNFMVRKATGSTPAIMGTKLKQHYIRTERFFELLLDTGSSSVAAGVIRLVLGYSKTVVVDMAFILEGKDESVLPENVFGCIRVKNYEFKTHSRYVDQP